MRCFWGCFVLVAYRKVQGRITGPDAHVCLSFLGEGEEYFQKAPAICLWLPQDDILRLQKALSKQVRKLHDILKRPVSTCSRHTKMEKEHP